MASWSFQFKTKTKAEALKVMDQGTFTMPQTVFDSVKAAVAGLPDVENKQVQVICHGNVGQDGGNVNVMVALVS